MFVPNVDRNVVVIDIFIVIVIFIVVVLDAIFSQDVSSTSHWY